MSSQYKDTPLPTIKVTIGTSIFKIVYKILLQVKRILFLKSAWLLLGGGAMHLTVACCLVQEVLLHFLEMTHEEEVQMSCVCQEMTFSSWCLPMHETQLITLVCMKHSIITYVLLLNVSSLGLLNGDNFNVYISSALKAIPLSYTDKLYLWNVWNFVFTKEIISLK